VKSSKKTAMSKYTVCLLLVLDLVGLRLAEAQQRSKIARLGYLTPSSSPTSYFESFQQGLRELGYIAGKNIVIERRANEGKLDRNPTLAAELANLKVDVIVGANEPLVVPRKSLGRFSITRRCRNKAGTGCASTQSRLR
jgi:putative ABC transport system substrate-binding protein